MEDTCHRCGAPVEDGVAFCAQCGAPQIRVTGAAPEPALPPMPPGTPGELQPAPLSPAGIDWPQALPAAMTAGVLLGLSWILAAVFPPITYFLWMLVGGVLAVALYARRRPGVNVTRGMGARLGAMTGGIAFLLFALLMAVQLLAFGRGGRMRSMMQEVVRQSAARNPDPRVQEMINRMMTPEGMAVLITVGMVIFLVGFLVFSSIGGALGASLFGRRDRRN